MKRLREGVRRLVPLLPSGARGFLIAYMIATSALAILDIVALGLLAAILTPMIQGRSTTLPIVGEIEPSAYPWVLLAVCALMVLKAVLALIIQWRATRRFAAYELTIGDALFDAYIRAPWTERASRSTAELVRLADIGIANTISGVLLPAISLPQQIATFAAVFAVLIVAQPLTAVITLVYLGLVAAFMYWGLSRAAVEAGRVNLRYSLRISTLMTEMMSALKEITLRDRFDAIARLAHVTRERSTRARANIQFLGAVPQRFVEAALVGGFLLVGGVAWMNGGGSQALSSIALFAVAGFRMVPSIVSFQSVMTTTANNLPHLEAVMDDIDEARDWQAHAEVVGHESIEGDPHELVVSDVTYTYPGAREPAVHDIDLTIRMGSSVALVGASGAGKSTLVDLLLGLLMPDEGRIAVDGQDLTDVLAAWRSRVGYVPQEVALFDATIAQNIALTWDDDIDMDRVRRAVDHAQLTQLVAERPGGLDARIGERGLALSGGERQRLGIARALYAEPLVLVLDEATSALDTATEDAVAASIRALHGRVTVISVAHRLSTIRHDDLVCFMRDGRMIAQGTFDELVESEPDFALQARLAGLA